MSESELRTALDVLVSALDEASSYNAAAEAAPHATLWCDGNRDFEPLLPLLRERLPQLLVHGAYDPTVRSGPAVWQRAAIAGAVPGLESFPRAVPIIYLPGIGRDTLRGAEDCPELLQPLVWLSIAGTFFGHVNGKDWTLRGFLSSERGPLKLEIAEGNATRDALRQAASRFVSRSLDELRGKRWDAGALHTLVTPDLPSDLLDWMDGELSEASAPDRFQALAERAKKELGFDIRRQSEHDAARKLVGRSGEWAKVWERFEAEGIGAHQGTTKLLRLQEPPADLFEASPSYPETNRREEDRLREQLGACKELSPADARDRVVALNERHAWRRETVWARGGEAPLAFAVEHLATLAEADFLPTQSANALSEAYASSGWKTDWAVLQALAAAPRDRDRATVVAVIRNVYMPWLDEASLALQEFARTGAVPLGDVSACDGADAVVFVDGLRMDVGHALVSLLKAEGAEAEIGWQWSGFPTITATCKPLVSPVAAELSGRAPSEDLLPVTPENKPAAKPVLYKTMAAAGWQTQPTLLADTKSWSETGRFDEEGHSLGSGLADRIDLGLRDAADHVLELVRAGRAVRIVTDHGWLLMPGGLPQCKLDSGLAEPSGKRARCARVKEGAKTSYLQIPWTWCSEVFVATASGANSFLANQEYAHGGLSPQEAIIPVIDVKPSQTVRRVSIKKLGWVGLRLRVQTDGGAGRRLDLRLGDGTSGDSLISGGRILDDEGRTSVAVPDEHEGEVATVVVLAEDDSVLTTRRTVVGDAAS